MSEKIDIEALKAYLPFYVNGSIEEPDKAAIDEALAVSPELREALEQERMLQDRFNDAMSAELDQLGEEAVEQPTQMAAEEVPSDRSSLSQALSFLNPRNWAPAVTFAVAAAVAGQTAVVVAQSGTIGDQQEQIAQLEAENFALASGQKDCEEQAAILLELRDTALWSEAADLIDAQGLTVIDATGQGVLSLSFEGDESQLEAAIDALEASQLVLTVSKAG